MAHNLSSPEIINTQETEQVGGEVFKENPVAVLARHLAGQYVLSQEVTGKPLPLHLLQQQEQFLNRAYQHFSRTVQQDITPSYAAEWLLDNFFVVQQAIRQIREDMPSGYYQQLPKLKNTAWAKYPRIYALAHEAIAYGNSQLSIEDTVALLQAFQAGGVSLTMGELWAFPTMLRLGILDSLTNALDSPCPGRDTVCIRGSSHHRRQPRWILHHQLTNVSHPGLERASLKRLRGRANPAAGSRQSLSYNGF